MKPWVREMLSEQGVMFNSADEEFEYQQRKLGESMRCHSEDALRHGTDGDRARYEQRVFDQQSGDYARQRNREYDQAVHRFRKADRPARRKGQ